MGSRLELQYLLESINGNQNVYYNPPSIISLNYPAIKYETLTIGTTRANNKLYRSTLCYTITVISRLPNDDVVTKLLELEMCKFSRHYIADGLNHYVLELYF